MKKDCHMVVIHKIVTKSRLITVKIFTNYVVEIIIISEIVKNVISGR